MKTNIYLSVFRESAQKIQVSLKSTKNNRYFTWRPTYILVFFENLPRKFKSH